MSVALGCEREKCWIFGETQFFCSYELVRHIQQKIEAAIGPLVDRRLESGMYGEEEGHDLVAQITEEIFTSPE